MEQLAFSYRNNENLLKDYFEKRAGTIIDLIITDNSTRMISIQTKEDRISLRLHRVFLDAGDEVIREIARFIKQRRCSTPVIRDFLRYKTCEIKGSPRGKINPKGGHYDLKEIFDEMNMEYFGGAVTAEITWGAKVRKRRVRKRTLGSYAFSTGTIRINPLLDNPDVPCYFISYIVYHEMLHAFLGAGTAGKRRSIHSKEFKAREKEFRDYEKAAAWERSFFK